MKVYIATNKDNKDALMHYGVKGMKWGKRGGRFKWPWENDDPNDSNRDDRGSGAEKSLHKIRSKGQGLRTTSRKSSNSRWSGNEKQSNLSTSPGRSERVRKSVKRYLRDHKPSTSQKTSSAPDKRIKQYFRDKIDRQRAEERKQEQQRRVDARSRQQDLKKEQINEKYWHGEINNAMHLYPYSENKYKQWKRENAGKKHTRGLGWLRDSEYNDRKTYRR